jgi:integrase
MSLDRGFRMSHLPGSISRRKGRRFYYVQFKNKKGDYLPAISTKQTSEDLAIETAFKWYRDGRPGVTGKAINVSLKDTVKSINNSAEVEFICKELKQRGFIKSYIIAGSKQSINFTDYLQDFWDYDTSAYVKEKLHRRHGIHRNYTIGQRLTVDKFWKPFFNDRSLGDITRENIELFINNLDDLAGHKLSAGRKNSILRSGVIPLRWAFSKEIIEKDVTTGIVWFSVNAKERQILTPEIVRLIFQTEWPNERSMMANLTASITGLRSGELQGLRIQDIGKDCLYIRHSWNLRDKLKTPKNNKERIVEISFPIVINRLLDLAGRNPHGASMDSYVFWAEKSATKPMEGRLFVDGLHDALQKIGMSRETASEYVFHGWRHFFTTYMRNRLDKKLLKDQTGHLTDVMFDHYGNHKTEDDREKIRQAQLEVFGALVPK